MKSFLTLLLAAVFFINCKKEFSAVNYPPVALAGPDQSITLPAMAILDGSGSYDPDGSPLASYLWQQLSGPAAAVLQSPAQAITNADGLMAGIYHFVLTVSDATGLTAADTIQLTVSGGSGNGNNLPPVANAGMDQALASTVNAASLDGTSSYDPDGTISSYAWAKISGPAQGLIQNPALANTVVNNLVSGSYQFQLTVTDNDGASAKDTVRITIADDACVGTRPIINAHLNPFASLSQARHSMAVGVVANKIVFAGGISATGISTVVDIYDVTTNTWSVASLSIARTGIAVATINNKIYFAGGHNLNGLAYSRIDIYDAVNNTWSQEELSEARSFASAVVVGNNLVIAGGGSGSFGIYNGSVRVDILNGITNSWSTASLSSPRSHMSGNVVGTKAYFAAGSVKFGINPVISSQVDVYDASTGAWSYNPADSLLKRRTMMAGISLGNKIFYAGGLTSMVTNGDTATRDVEIWDVTTNARTKTCLHRPNSSFDAVVKNDDVVFFTGFSGSDGVHFDIWNTATSSWKIAKLNRELFYASIITFNNEIFVAGGTSSQGAPFNNVWKLGW